MPSGVTSANKKGPELIAFLENQTTDQHQPAGINYWLSDIIDCTSFSGIELRCWWTITTGNNPTIRLQMSPDGKFFYQEQAVLLLSSTSLPRLGIYTAGNVGNYTYTTTGLSNIDNTADVPQAISNKHSDEPPHPFMRFMISTAVTARQDFEWISIYGHRH